MIQAFHISPPDDCQQNHRPGSAIASICPLRALCLSCAGESNIKGEKLHSGKGQSRSESFASRA